MKSSDIDNVLAELHKNSFSHQLARVDQAPERDETHKENEFIISEKDRHDTRGRNRHWPWKQTLYVKPAWLKAAYIPRKQNYPLYDLERENSNEDLRDYSKVYLVLDPNAELTPSDVRDLSNMVSSALTKANTAGKSSAKDRVQRKRRNKAFVVKNNRRRMRESKEKYADKSSVERDRLRRPERSAGGRTAIPYAGHRGDVFERE